MSIESTTAAPPVSFSRRVIIEPLGPITRYHIRQTFLLSSVPLVCGMLLVSLISIFAKLNLYFLESNGLIVNEQVRDAYFSQVQIEMADVAGYLVLLLAVTAAVSAIMMRWASAPFRNAQHTLETALSKPEDLRPSVRWLSESPFFDRVIWLFALRIKNGGGNQVKDTKAGLFTNGLFLLKYCISFGFLSAFTGVVMGIVINSVYNRVITLATLLVQNSSVGLAQHYLIAQQEVLLDAAAVMTITSVLIYLVAGLRISKYMTSMIKVFTRALEEEHFPIQLRDEDIYHSLAATLNRAREKIK